MKQPTTSKASSVTPIWKRLVLGGRKKNAIKNYHVTYQVCIGPTIRIGRGSWCLLYA